MDTRAPSLAALILVSFAAIAEAVASQPADAQNDAPYVYLISPSDGSTVTNPVTVRFGLRGFGVAPAGVDKPNTGHHHLLVDVEKLPDLSKPVPKNSQFLHFGGGQTETTLQLNPGKHTLQLILGDKDHTPLGPQAVSPKITIEVQQ